MTFTFGKEERLCSQKLIDQLYSDGRRLMAFPYSVMWREEPSLEVPCQVLIVAPKRRFHHAVDRNHAKRITRECYRLLKPQLYSALQHRGMHITLGLVYVGNEILPFEKTLRKMEKLLTQLTNELTHEKADEPAE